MMNEIQYEESIYNLDGQGQSQMGMEEESIGGLLGGGNNADTKSMHSQ